MVGKGKTSHSHLATLGHPSHHHHHRPGHSYSHGATTTRIGVNNMPSIVGRKLAMATNLNSKCTQKHSLLASDFTNPNCNENSISGSRHTNRNCNVAIATQVINPSAIGGSLHRRRLVRPFESDEDDESFGGRRSSRSKVNWNKIACYAIAISAVVLVMTGVVLAVGYMQSEKQRILTRSAKLAQERNASIVLMNEFVPDLPYNVTYHDDSSETHSNFETTEYFPPFGPSEEISGSDSAEELQIIEPSHEEYMNSDSDSDHHETEPVSKDGTVTGDGDGDAHVSLKPATEKLIPTTIEEDKLGIGESVDTEFHPALQHELHKSPSEVVVLPPKDFNFKGFSFEIPIYNQSGKDETSFTFEVLPLSTTTPSLQQELNFTASHNNIHSSAENDIPVVAKLQTDLFESGESGPEFEDNAVATISGAKNKGRSENGGRNPPKVNIPDRSYTPRPSSVPKYPERPRPPPPRPTIHKSTIKFNIGDANNGGDLHVASSTPSYNHYNDFQFSPSIPPAAAPPIDFSTKFDFSVTPTTTNSLFDPKNFKFDFTTPSAAVTLPSTNVDLRFDFNNFATANGLDLTSFNTAPAVTPPIGNNNLEFDFSQFSTPTSVLPVGVNIDPVLVSDSQLSKRTFQYQNPIPFQFDSSFSSSANTNHFAHLLGPQNVVGTIGSTSPVGASINLYNLGVGGGNNYGVNNNGGNYYGGGEEGNPSLAPGVIPLDLASSYIQAGPPGIIYNNNNGGDHYNGGGSFSYNDPTLALTSFTQNHYNPNSGSGGYTGNAGNNEPNYNTITQGMHLLSLLSGNIPKHLLTGQDQHTSSSITNFQQDISSKPEYQIAGLTGYGGSSTGFLTGLNLGTGNHNPYLLNSGQSQSYTADLYPTKHFPDQEGSFSQNIISRLKLSEHERESSAGTTTLGRSGKSISTSPLSSGTTIPKLPPTVEDHGPTLDLLGIRELLNKFIKSGSTSSSSADDKTESEFKSKNKNLVSDLETAASEAFQSQLNRPDLMVNSNSSLVTVGNYPEFGRRLVLKTPSQIKYTAQSKDESVMKAKSEKGLKSGFYI